MADLSAMFKTDYTGKYAPPKTFSEPVLTMDQLLIRDPTPMPKKIDQGGSGRMILSRRCRLELSAGVWF
jgi:hypothetical protein